MIGSNLLTFSRATTYNLCRRKHFNRYVLGVRREPGEALRIGSAIHHVLDLLKRGVGLDDALDWVFGNYEPLLSAADSLDRADAIEIERGKVVELIRGYVNRWSPSGNGIGLEIVASELPFNLSIRKSLVGRQRLLIMRHAGKMDGLCVVDGRLLLLEHKTTSDKIEMGSPYWQRVRIDAQISQYTIAAHRLGYMTEGVLYDCIRKPSIRRRVNDSVDDYIHRLRDDIAERPEFYFARAEVPRTYNDLEEAALELWQTAKAIHETKKNGHHFRNTSACVSPYRCEYLDVCENGTDLSLDPPPDGFVRVEDVNPELEQREEPHGSGTTTTEESSTEYATKNAGRTRDKSWAF